MNGIGTRGGFSNPNASRIEKVAEIAHNHLVSLWMGGKIKTLTRDELKDTGRFAPLSNEEAHGAVRNLVRLWRPGLQKLAILGLRVEGRKYLMGEGNQALVKFSMDGGTEFVCRTFRLPSINSPHFEWQILPYVDSQKVKPPPDDIGTMVSDFVHNDAPAYEEPLVHARSPGDQMAIVEGIRLNASFLFGSEVSERPFKKKLARCKSLHDIAGVANLGDADIAEIWRIVYGMGPGERKAFELGGNGYFIETRKTNYDHLVNVYHVANPQNAQALAEAGNKSLKVQTPRGELEFYYNGLAYFIPSGDYQRYGVGFYPGSGRDPFIVDHEEELDGYAAGPLPDFADAVQYALDNDLVNKRSGQLFLKVIRSYGV